MSRVPESKVPAYGKSTRLPVTREKREHGICRITLRFFRHADCFSNFTNTESDKDSFRKGADSAFTSWFDCDNTCDTLMPPVLRSMLYACLRRSRDQSLGFATTFCLCSPKPAMPVINLSPGFRKTCGVRPSPTPGGVPVAIRSPGSSVMKWLR